MLPLRINSLYRELLETEQKQELMYYQMGMHFCSCYHVCSNFTMLFAALDVVQNMNENSVKYYDSYHLLHHQFNLL